MKYKEKIIPVAYLLIIIGLAYFSLKILLTGINEKVDNLQTEALDQEIRLKKIEGLAQIKTDFERVQAQSEALKVLMPESETVVLIKEIEAIAEKTGNEIEIEIEEKSKEKAGVKKSKKEDVSNIETEKDIIDTFPAQNLMKMKLSLFGSYNSVSYFVQQIESIKYWSGILGLKIVNRDLRGVDVPPVRSPFGNPETSGAQETTLKKAEKMSAVIEIVFFLEADE